MGAMSIAQSWKIVRRSMAGGRLYFRRRAGKDREYMSVAPFVAASRTDPPGRGFALGLNDSEERAVAAQLAEGCALDASSADALGDVEGQLQVHLGEHAAHPGNLIWPVAGMEGACTHEAPRRKVDEEELSYRP